jgi:glycosyltransferase involved in cell wall biosynthesis
MNLKPLVLLPTYNSGARLAQTLREAHAQWDSVWVVVDASTDGSDTDAESLGLEGVRFFRLSQNSGKGAAVHVALQAAQAEGFTHVLVMDADGQHPAAMIRPFFEISKNNPAAFVCGFPVFGPDAPRERVLGRLVGNFFATLETLGAGAEDSLFGFRLYPIVPALEILKNTKWARRFDFDTVLSVRLTWAGLPCINVAVPVFYPPRSEGGVTHFRYLRDNLLLVAAHARLLLEWPFQALCALRGHKPSGGAR